MTGNTKKLIIFIILTAGALGIVLFLTVNEKTIGALGKIQPVFLVACFGLWFVSFSSDALSNFLFVRGADERIRIPDAYRLAAIRIFFNLITPFSSGGQPVSIYILHKFGVPPGKGSSIIVTRLMCWSFYSAAGAILALVFFGELISSNPAIQTAFLVTGISIVVSYGIAITGLLHLPFLGALIKIACKVLHSLRIVKDEAQFIASGMEQARGARDSFKNYFTRHPAYFTAGFLSCSGWYVSQVLILYFITRGLGVPVDIGEGFALSALLIFLISFAPTPGGTGLGEVIFLVLFSGTVAKEIVGIALVLWRIFYQYLSAVLGAVFTARYFSSLWSKTQETKKDDAQTP